MILDKISNAEFYNKMHPLFEEAFHYLQSIDFHNVPTGVTELKGKSLFAIVSDSNLKAEQDALPEIHNNYIDIQMPISKPETFGWIARSDMKDAKGGFDTAKDIQFFSDKKNTFFTVKPGHFIIFFPQDGHAPCIGEGCIRKVVVKIKL